MPKTQKRFNLSKSIKRFQKNKDSKKINKTNNFEKEITLVFLEMILMVKLFHWKTHSYATHKATDELYASLNENMDKFVEVLLGKTGSRINLTGQSTITLIDLDSQEKLKSKIDSFKSYLVSLTNNKIISSMTNTDLLNIRDEILGDLNKFLYLLTFK